MKKIFAFLFVTSFLFLANPVFAENPASTTSQANIVKQLQEQIKTLQTQIEQLTTELVATRNDIATIKEELQITKTLKFGMTDEEVKKLQSFLKTMPDVYPEGLVTGYYGQLTAKAVKKFQEKNADDVLKPLGLAVGTGVVGEKTMEKMNRVMIESNSIKGSGVVNEEKVTICHFPQENSANKQTITVGTSALPAHKAHGDTIGVCSNEQIPPLPTPVPIACTADVKICPDGSSVSRTSPKCEFTSCPVNTTSQYYLTVVSPVRWETWTTGSSYYIKWLTNIPATQNITIVRVRDSAGSEHELLTEMKNDGIELLTIPSTLASGTYHFEMKAVVGNQSVFGESENTITIVNPNAPAPDPAEVPETKIITVSAEGGYGIIGPGTLAVVVGSDQSFTITPAPGYQVASVIADGVNQGALLSYTFTNVQSAHSLVISFKPISPAPTGQYSITATQGASGTIFPALASVTAGSSITFTITPATGYQVASVTVDGKNQGAISSYTFSNVTSAHLITATFSPISTTQSCSLTVSLAATTPAAQNISPSQNGVSLIKFNATPNCDGTLNSFAVSLLPMPNGYQNISALRLYNEVSGVQLGTTQNVTGASVNFASVNTPLTANQALVLKVTGDVSPSAVNGSTVYGVFGGSSAVTSSGGMVGNNASGNIIMGNTMTVATIIPTQDSTSVIGTNPRIMYWWGKVNQHTDANGNWLTDPDGVSGADLDKLTYCKKFFPNTTGVEDYMLETTNTWLNRGNVDGPFTSIKMSTKCLQPIVSTLSTNNQLASAIVALQKLITQLQEFLKNR